MLLRLLGMREHVIGAAEDRRFLLHLCCFAAASRLLPSCVRWSSPTPAAVAVKLTRNSKSGAASSEQTGLAALVAFHTTSMHISWDRKETLPFFLSRIL